MQSTVPSLWLTAFFPREFLPWSWRRHPRRDYFGKVYNFRFCWLDSFWDAPWLFKMGLSFVGWSHFIDWSEVMGSVAIRACFMKSLKEGNSPLSSLHCDTKPAHLVMTQSGNLRGIFRFSRLSFRTRRLLMLFIAVLHCLKKLAYLCRAVPSLWLIRYQFSSLSLKASAITNWFPCRSSSKPLASSKMSSGGSKKVAFHCILDSTTIYISLDGVGFLWQESFGVQSRSGISILDTSSDRRRTC